MSDFEKLINASDLIEWIIETCPDWCEGAIRTIVDHIDEMPSAQPEPSISLSWIDEQIERLKGMDNAFATLTAMQISVMVKKWSEEQDDS